MKKTFSLAFACAESRNRTYSSELITRRPPLRAISAVAPDGPGLYKNKWMKERYSDIPLRVGLLDEEASKTISSILPLSKLNYLCYCVLFFLLVAKGSFTKVSRTQSTSTGDSAVCLNSLSVSYHGVKRPLLILSCISARYLVDKAILCLLERSSMRPSAITIRHEVFNLIASDALHPHHIATFGDNLRKDAIYLNVFFIAPQVTCGDVWHSTFAPIYLLRLLR